MRCLVVVGLLTFLATYSEYVLAKVLLTFLVRKPSKEGLRIFQDA